MGGRGHGWAVWRGFQSHKLGMAKRQTVKENACIHVQEGVVPLGLPLVPWGPPLVSWGPPPGTLGTTPSTLVVVFRHMPSLVWAHTM